MIGTKIIEIEANNQIANTSTISDSSINYKNKNIRIIVDNEEIYTINMILPKANRGIIKTMIKDELGFRFKNLDKIMFDYIILKKNKNSIEAEVFCLNCNSGELIKTLIDKGAKIEGIYPLQLYILRKFNKKIKDKNFYFIFLYEKSLYITVIVDKFLVMNKIYKNFEDNYEKVNINQFKEKINILYYANIDKNNLNEFIDKEINFIDLGCFNHNDIFKKH